MLVFGFKMCRPPEVVLRLPRQLAKRGGPLNTATGLTDLPETARYTRTIVVSLPNSTSLVDSIVSVLTARGSPPVRSLKAVALPMSSGSRLVEWDRNIGGRPPRGSAKKCVCTTRGKHRVPVDQPRRALDDPWAPPLPSRSKCLSLSLSSVVPWDCSLCSVPKHRRFELDSG
jgi:hypothetical protein